MPPMKSSLCLIVISSFLFCAQAFAEPKSFTLKDGSVIKGELVSFQGGIYTVQTANLGRLLLSEANVDTQDDFGSVTQDWLALNGDVFDLTERWDQLSGYCTAGKLRVVRKNSELVVELLSVAGHQFFPHTRFDARLALAVARSQPELESTQTLIAETKRVDTLVKATA